MKKIILSSVVLTVMISLMSFTQTDFSKFLIGKWELQTIQSPGKAAMSVKEILGDSFMEFKSDYTYIESGGREQVGVWQLTKEKYLQTKSEKQAAFTDKIELKEISADKIEMISSDKKIFTYTRVK